MISNLRKVSLLFIIASWKIAMANSHSDFQVSFIGAIPDARLDYVQETLADAIALHPRSTLEDMQYANDVFWSLHSLGVAAVNAIGVLRNASSDIDLILQALDEVDMRGPGIVFLTLGPLLPPICARMLQMENSLFLVSSGFSAKNLDETRAASCNSANILTIAPLNALRNDLYSSANFGNSVNFAAPAFPAGLKISRQINPHTRMIACSVAQVVEDAANREGGFSVPATLVALQHSLHRLPNLINKTFDGQALLSCPHE